MVPTSELIAQLNSRMTSSDTQEILFAISEGKRHVALRVLRNLKFEHEECKAIYRFLRESNRRQQVRMATEVNNESAVGL